MLLPLLQRVLLVDHDQTSTFLTERILRRAGIAAKIVAVSTGQQALALLADPTLAPPELLFVSWDRPYGVEMPMRDFLLEFQRQFSHYPCVVAILAVSIHPWDLDLLRKAHVGPIFDKPLTKEDVHQLMQDYFLQPATH
jgi:CheY-like chemotaxis protein